jgi:hypothetical protein
MNPVMGGCLSCLHPLANGDGAAMNAGMGDSV